MIDSLLLSFREGLEAALIIGIILAHLIRVNRKDLTKVVYIGAFIGVILSFVVGGIGFNEVQEAGEGSEEIFEGVMMLLSAGLIAYFILWLHRSQKITSTVTDKISKNTSLIGILILSFLSVFREGMELVTFNLTKITENALSVVFGNLIGIIIAILVAIIIFKTSIKFNLGVIFKLLGLVLIFIGGEMFGEGLVKLFDGGESVEITGMLIFIVLSFLIFFKSEIQKFTKRASA